MPPECGQNLDIPKELCSSCPHLIAFDSIHIKTEVGHVITHPKIRSCNHVPTLSSVTTHPSRTQLQTKTELRCYTATHDIMSSIAASVDRHVAAKTKLIPMGPQDQQKQMQPARFELATPCSLMNGKQIP
jgi:hypothetical protein